jgi:hypothetical protein
MAPEPPDQLTVNAEDVILVPESSVGWVGESKTRPGELFAKIKFKSSNFVYTAPWTISLKFVIPETDLTGTLF